MEAQGSAMVAARAAKSRATAGMAQEETGEGRRWCERNAKPLPSSYSLIEVAEEPFPS